jgi:hypothetical protein
VANSDGTIGRGSGTSFSSPIIAGLVACLWQSKPSVTNYDVYEAMQRSASQYANPDSLLGYGIPDFSNAFIVLKVDKTMLPATSIFPNPFTDHLTLQFTCSRDEQINLLLFDETGRPLIKRVTQGVQGQNTVSLENLSGLSRGIYFIRISCDTFTGTKKMVKW